MKRFTRSVLHWNSLLRRSRNKEKIDLKLHYKGQVLKQFYQPNFFCFDRIIVEIKAVKQLKDEHRAQVINYVKSTGVKLGLLVNFGHHPGLEYERFVNEL